jgi:hypothetical protein
MRCQITLLVLVLVGLSILPMSGEAVRVPLQTRVGSVDPSTPDGFVLSLLTLTYDKSSTAIRFSATERLPGAGGQAKVEHKNGVTKIEIELDRMRPAWSFGGDFNTYVLWAVSPEGHTDNLGEFILNGNRSKLNVSTRVDTFGLIVTAEPHFMVDHPSPFVVLVNRDPGISMRRPPQLVQVKLPAQIPPYRFERESLLNVPRVRGEVSSALRQANVAVQRAIACGRLSPDELRELQESLYRAEGAAETRTFADPDVEVMARRTVRLAVAAEKRATANDVLPLSVVK